MFVSFLNHFVTAADRTAAAVTSVRLSASHCVWYASVTVDGLSSANCLYYCNVHRSTAVKRRLAVRQSDKTQITTKYLSISVYEYVCVFLAFIVSVLRVKFSYCHSRIQPQFALRKSRN